MSATIRTIAASMLVLAAVSKAPAQPQSPAVEYRFDAVKRKVVVTSGSAELRNVEQGGVARSGDKVATGWFSYALIASPAGRARFEIFSATDVVLADGTPGVILSVERGRIRAAFDKIVGSEPRVVKTPGALLAVRGTQFDVEVDSNGDTTVDVFDGIVEVQSPLRPESMFIRAGEESTFGRRVPPSSRPIPEHRRRDDGQRNPRGGPQRTDDPATGRDGHDGRDGRDGGRPDGHNQPPGPNGAPQSHPGNAGGQSHPPPPPKP
jgi:hypothetical protein